MNDVTQLTPPIAAKRPSTVTYHGVTVSDDYAWLRDKGYPKVEDKEILAHLAAENSWFEARMKPHQGTIDALFKEMRGRIKEADKSVPQKDGDWLYWIEFEEGAEYKKWWRRPLGAKDDGSADELILDEPALAEGKDYFRLGAIATSKDGKLLAYSVDDNGSERFTARIKDLTTGEHLPDEIPGTLSGLSWVAGDKGLVYSLANEQWRTDNARLHWLGQPIDQDVELYHEDDEGFRVSASLSAAEDWLIIGTGDHETSEAWLVPADAPLTPPRLVRARRKGVEYDVDVRPGADGPTLFVHTNDTHENFRLATAPLAKPDEWTTLVEGTDAFYLTGFELFRDSYVVDGRLGGLDRIEIRYYDDARRIEPIEFPEASYTAHLGNNPEFEQTVLRVGYESMVSPASTYDFDVARRELKLLKVQEIPSGYDRSIYATERLEIAARFRLEDHLSAGAVLDRAARIHELGFAENGAAGGLRGPLELDQRRMANGIDNAVANGHASVPAPKSDLRNLVDARQGHKGRYHRA